MSSVPPPPPPTNITSSDIPDLSEPPAGPLKPTSAYMDKVRSVALPALTGISHASSAFIGTFLLVHLAAPIAGNAGSNIASQMMLLGREYYQTAFGEKFLVLGPIAVHATASCMKRLLSPPGKPPRRLTGGFSASGYFAGLFFVPIHYLTHRAYPASPAAPISCVGPSELDYDFVKTGLQKWPKRSWALYIGLTAFVVFHAVDGLQVIFKQSLKGVAERWTRMRRNKRMGVVTLGVLLPVFSGLAVLGREDVMAFGNVVSRYEADRKSVV